MMEVEKQQLQQHEQSERKERIKWFGVIPRPNFIAAKSIQFFYQLAFGSTFHHLPHVYQHTHGMNLMQIGMLQAIAFIVGFPSCIIWANIADRWQLRRRILAILAVMTSVLVPCLIFKLPSFAMLSVLAAVIFFFHSPMIPIGDTLTLDLLGTKQHLYGQQRIWGAIAAGLGSCITGQLVDVVKNDIPGLVSFSVYSVFFLIAVVTSFLSRSSHSREKPRNERALKKLEHVDPANPEIQVDHPSLSRVIGNNIHAIHPEDNDNKIMSEAKEKSNSVVDKSEKVEYLRHWLLHRDIMGFYLSLIGLNMTLYCCQTFCWPFLQNEKNASTSLTGWTAPFQVLVELPFFFYDHQVLNYVGIKKAMLLAHAGLVIRLLFYPYLPNTSPANWIVLPLDLLNGFAFAFMWSAAIQFVNAIAPENRKTTSQGVFAAVVSLGGAAGNSLGGYLYQNYGSTVMWFTFAIITTVTGMIYSLVPIRDLNGLPKGKNFFEKKSLKKNLSK